MKCPNCGIDDRDGKNSKVIDSRHTQDNKARRRRRECLKCRKRFTTYEVLTIPMPEARIKALRLVAKSLRAVADEMLSLLDNGQSQAREPVAKVA